MDRTTIPWRESKPYTTPTTCFASTLTSSHCIDFAQVVRLAWGVAKRIEQLIGVLPRSRGRSSGDNALQLNRECHFPFPLANLSSKLQVRHLRVRQCILHRVHRGAGNVLLLQARQPLVARSGRKYRGEYRLDLGVRRHSAGIVGEARIVRELLAAERAEKTVPELVGCGQVDDETCPVGGAEAIRLRLVRARVRARILAG